MLQLFKPLQQMLLLPTNPLEGCCLTFSPPFLLLAGFSKSRTCKKHNYHLLIQSLSEKRSSLMQPLFARGGKERSHHLVINRGGLGTSLYSI